MSRLFSAQQCLRHSEKMVTEHTTALRSLQTKIRALEYKADDAEDCNGRNNLCIVSLAEGVEGSNPTVFRDNLLRTLLPVAKYSPFYAVERAHHIPPKPGTPGPTLHLQPQIPFEAAMKSSKQPGCKRTSSIRMVNYLYPLIILWKHRNIGGPLTKLKLPCMPVGFITVSSFQLFCWFQDGEFTRFFTSPREASIWLESLPPNLPPNH